MQVRVAPEQGLLGRVEGLGDGVVFGAKTRLLFDEERDQVVFDFAQEQETVLFVRVAPQVLEEFFEADAPVRGVVEQVPVVLLLLPLAQLFEAFPALEHVLVRTELELLLLGLGLVRVDELFGCELFLRVHRLRVLLVFVDLLFLAPSVQLFLVVQEGLLVLVFGRDHAEALLVGVLGHDDEHVDEHRRQSQQNRPDDEDEQNVVFGDQARDAVHVAEECRHRDHHAFAEGLEHVDFGPEDVVDGVADPGHDRQQRNQVQNVQLQRLEGDLQDPVQRGPQSREDLPNRNDLRIKPKAYIQKQEVARVLAE